MSCLKRGLLVVLEGADRVGKSTAAAKLVETFIERGDQAELIAFPYRKTKTGELINNYLKGESELNDHVIHLLFSANRWEFADMMRTKLTSGITLVVDRYAFSGVAYSAAKGMPLDWCKSSDVGLPRPDVVFYLSAPDSVISSRKGFGDEVYESNAFQKKVKQVYEQLKDELWRDVDADRNADVIHSELIETIDEIKNGTIMDLKGLWSQSEICGTKNDDSNDS